MVGISQGQLPHAISHWDHTHHLFSSSQSLHFHIHLSFQDNLNHIWVIRQYTFLHSLHILHYASPVECKMNTEKYSPLVITWHTIRGHSLNIHTVAKCAECLMSRDEPRSGAMEAPSIDVYIVGCYPGG